jgi:hypothetical protein
VLSVVPISKKKKKNDGEVDPHVLGRKIEEEI